MTKKHLNNHWRNLDNTAKIFSLNDQKNTNTFRFSIMLKHNVDEVILKKALEKTLCYYSIFKVKFKTGLFWNYLVFNSKEPIIIEDNNETCRPIDLKKNNDYLFRVSYYRNKINLDFFHALTDGAGAIQFLKAIIYNYLDFRNNLSVDMDHDSNMNYHDQYLKNYDKDLTMNVSSKKAYQLPGKRNKKVNNTYHYIINVNEIKKVCKSYNVSITEYLTATYIYAMYLSVYDKDSKQEIIISVPVDLRKYYQVDTLFNFFVCMNINSKIVEKNLTTFDEILKQVHIEFQNKLEVNKVKRYLTNDVKLGTNIFIHVIPLFIKKIFMRFFGTLVSKTSTSTLSNVGVIDIDDKYKKEIDNILVTVMPGKVHKIKCTICSFDKNLNITVNSNINDVEFEQSFLKLLQGQIKSIKVDSNKSID